MKKTSKMKNAMLLSVLLVFACKNKDAKSNHAVTKDTANYTTIQWVDSVKDIGDVKAGEKAKVEFRFKNTGDKPLFIMNAEPGCGCTVADYPQGAIAPGEEGVLKAEYTASPDGSGEFRKNIAVTTNTKGKEKNTIYFHGKVLNAEDLKNESKAHKD